MEEKLILNVTLQLNAEELSQFFWNLYGVSLVDFKDSKEAMVGYKQMVEQVEEFLMELDPENKHKIPEVKKVISESIKRRMFLN